VSNSVRIVRNQNLEPAWTVKQAKEPGFMRSLITWVGGPEGFINTNPGVSVTSQKSAIGLMRMPAGNRQAGVHVHSVAEIYVILKGEAESFDGMGNRHRAGPMDCLYIPAGVPHGVRTVGDMDLELVWLHDAIERNGVSVYLDGPGPFPAEEECKLIAYRDLAPDWGGEGAKAGGTLRWCINWVAGQGRSHNLAEAASNPKLGIGMTAILPNNSGVAHSHLHPETYLVLSGTGAVSAEGETAHLARLDAAYFPAETPHVIRNTGDQTLHVLWAHELG
jgi:mannose-6-phosphate isomerase-like protein (cupin superfamily)